MSYFLRFSTHVSSLACDADVLSSTYMYSSMNLELLCLINYLTFKIFFYRISYTKQWNISCKTTKEA